jgi:hypothetical protein
MDDLQTERENLLLDIALLRKLLDLARNRQPPDDLTVRACSEVLRDRYARLERLERGA